MTNGNNGQHVENEMFNESSTTIPRRKYRNAFILLWSHFKGAYTNPDVIIWSIWYSVAMCGNLQVISYVQVLWATIDDSFQVIYKKKIFMIFDNKLIIFCILA